MTAKLSIRTRGHNMLNNESMTSKRKQITIWGLSGGVGVQSTLTNVMTHTF